MGNPRPKPQYLAAKLLAIREGLGLSQGEMVQRLNFQTIGARISEYERGIREPNLIVLLAYAKVARVRAEVLIDDTLELPKRLKQNKPL